MAAGEMSQSCSIFLKGEMHQSVKLFFNRHGKRSWTALGSTFVPSTKFFSKLQLRSFSLSVSKLEYWRSEMLSKYR